MFYKAIVQAILLYGSETWTITSAMMKALRGFHNRVARRTACRCPKQRPDGSWDYPRIETARRIASLYTIEHYVAIRQRSFVDKVATRPIHELCEVAQRRSGSAASKIYWWTQPKLARDDDVDEQVNVVSDEDSEHE
jgi:hypothetical protein